MDGSLYYIKEDITVGMKVRYQPSHFPEDKWENGIIKEIVDPYYYRVVFYCGGNWENYMNYTSALTKATDLKPGWK